MERMTGGVWFAMLVILGLIMLIYTILYDIVSISLYYSLIDAGVPIGIADILNIYWIYGLPACLFLCIVIWYIVESMREAPST